ncbi:MAG TPA: FtsX-like permease family protein [Verrucomicrobiae bacterium]|nr:FtsX-like permease family protein [Verrucomicrobiae bacterium]
MFRLALKTLRYRQASFLGAFLAIFAGVAIIMACGGLMETGIRLDAPPERLNAPILVSRDYESGERARISGDTIKKAEAVSGVETVVRDVSFAAEITGAPATPGLHGHAWESAQLTPYTLASGQAPSRADQVVVDSKTAEIQNVQVGDKLTISVKGKPSDFTVSGVAKTTAAFNQPALFFETNFGLSQIDGGWVDVLGIVPASGADVEQVRHDLSVALASDNVLVLTGDDRGQAEYSGMSGAREVLIAGSAPFGGNTVVVVVFVVASILGLSIRQRTREMALLQTIGATPGQVRGMVVAEVMVIAILATALAIIPGYWLGEFMLDALKSVRLVPEPVVFYQGFIPVLIGVCVGLVSALVASLLAARHATRVQPIEALADVATQRRWFSWWKLGVAIACLLGGLSLAIVTALVMRGALASSTAGPAVLPWLLAFGLMAPALIIPGLALFAGPLRLFGHGTGFLAVKNARVRYLQSAAMVTPIMLASAMALSMLYQQATLSETMERTFTQDIKADSIVQATSNGFSVETAKNLGQISGVTASSPLLVSEGRFLRNDGSPDEEPFRMQGISVETGKPLFAHKFVAGSFDGLTGQTLALSKGNAEYLNRKVGDTVKVRFSDGRDETLRLVAIYEAQAGFESGIVPADLLAPHTASGLISTIALQTNATTNPGELKKAVEAATKASVQLSSGDSLRSGVAGQVSVLSWVNTLFTIMVTLYALLFLINTVVITILARRREFALQRLIGSTRREVLRMTMLEAASMSILGVIGGILVSSVSLVPFSIAVNGSPLPGGGWMILLGVIAGALLLNLLVTWLAATAALRVPPIKAAANRE